ncbi:MAG: hypothetical protein H7836_12720 [Magnetococcus sp. YQC-3]
MKITSVTDYLLNQMVRSASGLQPQNRENTTQQGVGKAQRERVAARTMESSRPMSSSSAYRVTISPAAMQKIAANGS